MQKNVLTMLSPLVASGLFVTTLAVAQDVPDAVPSAEAAPTAEAASAAEAAPAAEAEAAPAEAQAAPAEAEAAPAEAQAAPAEAAPAAAAPAEAAPAEEEEGGVGLNLDVQVASAYVWRGMNLWGPDQDSQNLSVFPGATLTVGDLSVGYWGAYQLTGETKGDKLDAGVGAEQDLYVGYGFGLTDELSLSLLATYYVYPFADEAAAGVKTPMYLEPLVSLSYSTAVDLGLSLGYYRGLQDASDLISHIYISPSVGKSIELASDLSLDLGASFGYKVWTNGDWDTDLGNNWDVLGNVGVSYAMGDLYLSPAVHAAYTDVAKGAKSGDGLAYWAGVNVGYDLAF